MKKEGKGSTQMQWLSVLLAKTTKKPYQSNTKDNTKAGKTNKSKVKRKPLSKNSLSSR